jgi:hypothetical protein
MKSLESNRQSGDALLQPRHGAILFLVLITGTIIAVIGLGGLITQSVYLQSSRRTNDSMQARQAVRSAIATGVQHVSADPSWRQNNDSGRWQVDVPLQNGSWSLQAVDPVDNVFSNNAADPLRFTGFANVGDSVQRGESTLRVQPLPHAALMYAASAQDDVEIESGDVECSGWLVARDRVRSRGASTIHADVSGANDVIGSGFKFQTRTDELFGSLPHIGQFTDLAKSAVPVAIGSVPSPSSSGADLLPNNGFSQGTIGWTTAGKAAVLAIGFGGHNNSACAYVHNRSVPSDALICDVTGSVRNGLGLAVNGYVLPLAADAAYRISVIVQTDGGTSVAGSWDSATVRAGDFFYTRPRYIAGAMTPVWSGRLKKAWLKIQTIGSGSDGTQNFVADQFTCRLNSAPAAPALHRQLVTPSSNPFGVADSVDGIFLIDCRGRDITISDCVIVGTVMFANAGTVTVGPGPVHWRPARPGLPAMVVDGNLEITTSRFAVSERELRRNFNPSGSPDEFGSTDNRRNDRYSSEIRGLVFARRDIICEGDVLIRGHLMARDDVILRQRVVIHPAPEYLTVPIAGTWTFDTLTRSTGDVRRQFD